MSHYDTLGIARDADLETIKKAYKNLARKWHPDKNNNTEIANQKFKQISEAYSILSSQELRAKYDRYGDEGLRQSSSHYQYSAGFNNEDIFTTIFEDFFRNEYASFNRSRSPPQKINISCTLEELYNGTTKHLEFTRESARVPFQIKPGYKHGQKLRIEAYNRIIIVVINEQPHKVFKRDGDNLIFTSNVSLKDALMSFFVKVKILNGEEKEFPIPQITDLSYQHMIPGKGMPIYPYTSQFGDLIIKFKLLLPKQLKAEQRDQVKKAFEGIEYEGNSFGIFESSNALKHPFNYNFIWFFVSIFVFVTVNQLLSSGLGRRY